LQGNEYIEIGRVFERLDYRTAALGYNINIPRISDRIVNKNRNFFANELPFETPIQIARREAQEIQARYRDRNRELCDLVPNLSLDDLEPDLEKYPEEGNLDEIMQEVSFAPMLREMVVRFNVELWMERARTQKAMCERAIARGNVGNARNFLATCRTYLDNARQGALPDQMEKVEEIAKHLGALERSARRSEKA